MIKALQTKCKTCFEVNLNLHLPQALFKMFTSIANKSAPPCFDKPQNILIFKKEILPLVTIFFCWNGSPLQKDPKSLKLKAAKGTYLVWHYYWIYAKYMTTFFLACY